MSTTSEPEAPAAFPEPQPSEEENLLSVISQEATMFLYSVGFPRFNAKIKPSEWGMDETVLDPDKISLGSKKLLGSQRSELKPFEQLESEITSFIEDNSFPFAMKLRCVPNKNLEAVHAKVKEIENRMNELQLMFISRYYGIKEKALEEWREYAVNCTAIKDPDAFVEGIEKAFPPIHKVSDAFKFRWNVISVKALEDVQLQVTTVQEQKAIMDARNQVAKEAREKIAQETEGFMEDVVVNLRAKCSELLTDMITSMNEGKLAVHQKTLNRLSNYIEHFRKMNFAGDVQLDQMLDGFEKEFLTMSAADLRKDEDALGSFKDALANLNEQTKELLSEDAKSVVDSFKTGKRKVVVD